MLRISQGKSHTDVTRKIFYPVKFEDYLGLFEAKERYGLSMLNVNVFDPEKTCQTFVFSQRQGC